MSIIITCNKPARGQKGNTSSYLQLTMAKRSNLKLQSSLKSYSLNVYVITTKYSKQILVLFINRLCKNIEITRENARKKCTAYKFIFNFLEMSLTSTTDKMSGHSTLEQWIRLEVSAISVAQPCTASNQAFQHDVMHSGWPTKTQT